MVVCVLSHYSFTGFCCERARPILLSALERASIECCNDGFVDCDDVFLAGAAWNAASLESLESSQRFLQIHEAPFKKRVNKTKILNKSYETTNYNHQTQTFLINTLNNLWTCSNKFWFQHEKNMKHMWKNKTFKGLFYYLPTDRDRHVPRSAGRCWEFWTPKSALSRSSDLV